MRNSPDDQKERREHQGQPLRGEQRVLKRQESGDRIKEREQQEQEEPVPVASQDRRGHLCAPAMRSRTPRVTTEARVELKAKPTANVPAMIWTIPKARNQPQFFRTPASSTATHDGVRVLRVGSHGCIACQRAEGLVSCAIVSSISAGAAHQV